MFRYLTLLLLPLMLLSACSDDETTLPSYVEGLADLTTNAAGRATSLVTDEGETLALSNEVSGLRPDTTYRILAAYLPGEGSAALNSYARILAPEVMKYKDEYVTTDPLSVTSCWRGASYINLRLNITGSATGTHYFGFHETEFRRNADGSATMCVVLIHDQNDDPLYYSRETYLSLPLQPLSSLLTTGRDSVRLSVKTFDGEYVRTFAY